MHRFRGRKKEKGEDGGAGLRELADREQVTDCGIKWVRTCVGMLNKINRYRYELNSGEYASSGFRANAREWDILVSPGIGRETEQGEGG